MKHACKPAIWITGIAVGAIALVISLYPSSDRTVNPSDTNAVSKVIETNPPVPKTVVTAVTDPVPAVRELIADPNVPKDMIPELIVNIKTNNDRINLIGQPLTGIKADGMENILVELDCRETYLSQLTLDGFKVLTTIAVPRTPITRISAQKCPKLICLDLTACPDLKEISLADDVSYTSLRLSDWRLNSVSNIDVSGCTGMKFVNCMDNPVVSLNIDGTERTLEELLCSNTKLTKITANNFTQIRIITAANTPITSFSAKNCPNLDIVDLTDCNKLTDVNVFGCKALKSLVLDGPVTNLNVTYCDNLKDIRIKNGQLSQKSVDSILKQLVQADAWDGTIDLTGSNAAPSYTGIGYKSNLESRIWKVWVK